MSAQPERQRPALGLDAANATSLDMLQQARRPEGLNQVRISRRVIIRISPGTPDPRVSMFEESESRSAKLELAEIAHDDCVEIADITSVASTRDNRLLLLMRNRDVLAAALERGCSARAFYSGFYVERSQDGQLCIARDMLQSRAGASCAIANLTQVVAAGG